MNKHLISLLVAAGSVFTNISSAQALTWDLDNVTFGFLGSETATGFFDYDTVTNTYNNVSITVDAGSITQNFDTSHVIAPGSASNSLYLEIDRGASTVPSTARYLGFRLVFDSDLNNIQATNINILTSGDESYFYANATPLGTAANNPFNRLNVQGGAVTSVPFDIPGGATIPTVGSLLALGVMRQVKKKMAAKSIVANPVRETVN